MTAAYHARHEGLLDGSIIASKAVLFGGLGSVGSEAARLITRAGVNRAVLVDKDVVSEVNLCRTTYWAADVGQPKSAALGAQLTASRPDVRAEPRDLDLFLASDEELIAMIESVDLVFLSTDHPPTQARLAALAYPRRPTVLCGVFAKGTGGEIIFTLPNETPCYACILGELRGANRPAAGQADYGFAPGQLIAEPALGADILHVTVCAAKIALALLVRETTSPVADIIDPTRNILFVGNAIDWIFERPFETVWGRADRRERCLCRLAPGESTASLLDDRPEEADCVHIAGRARSAPPDEPITWSDED